MLPEVKDVLIRPAGCGFGTLHQLTDLYVQQPHLLPRRPIHLLNLGGLSSLSLIHPILLFIRSKVMSLRFLTFLRFQSAVTVISSLYSGHWQCLLFPVETISHVIPRLSPASLLSSTT